MTAVSVIIPSYGQARLLTEAVQSVRDQTFGDWETVVIASDEESARAVYPFSDADSRVRVIESPPAGASHARNIGASSSSAGLLLTLDADDKLAPKFLERTVTTISQSRYAISYADVAVFGDGAGQWCPAYNRSTLLSYNCLPSSSLHTRALWEAAGGWNVALLGYEDYEYWVSCSRHDPVVTHVSEGLFLYRHWGGQSSQATSAWGGEAWSEVWRAMIRVCHPDLYPARQQDLNVIAHMDDKLRERLRTQLSRFPDNPHLRQWVDLLPNEG